MPPQGGFAGDYIQKTQVRYDFGIDTGAINTALNLRRSPLGTIGPTPIPPNAVVVGGFLSVLVACTGATSQHGLSVESAGDLVAATVVTGAPYSTTGLKVIIPVFTVATFIQVTVLRDLKVAISVAATTAGVYDLVVFWTSMNS